MVFAELAGLIETTKAATKDALFGSEDLLQRLKDRDLCDGIAYYGADDTSDSEDDGEDSTLRNGATDVEGPSMTEDCFLWNDCDTADGHDEPKKNTASPPAVTNVVTKDIKAQTLHGYHTCKRAQNTVIDTVVSDVGRETNPSGAGHTGGNLDDDKLEGIERLQTAFKELKHHITEAWNDAMVMVVDKLAFTKINTLMTVVRGAADRVIETSARFVREAKAKTPHNLDAQGHQTPQCVAPIHLLGENAYGVVRNDHDDHNTDGVPADAQEFARNTAARPGGGPQRPVPDPPKPNKYPGIITTTIVSDAKLGVVKETGERVAMSSGSFRSHFTGQYPLRSGADPTEQIHGSPRTMGEDISRRGSPTLEEGNHEPKRYRPYEGNHERLVIFGGRGRTVPT